MTTDKTAKKVGCWLQERGAFSSEDIDLVGESLLVSHSMGLKVAPARTILSEINVYRDYMVFEYLISLQI